MVNIESLRQAPLGADNIDSACELVEEAGWNQTPDDWRLFIRNGDAVCFVDGDGAVIATAAVLPYGCSFGWISMVLVRKAWRRRGIAARILEWCVRESKAKGIDPVLDATPEGEKVYSGLGFLGSFGLRRWRADAVSPGLQKGSGIRLANETDMAHVEWADREVFGGERSFLIRDFKNRSRSRVWVANGQRTGVAISRSGRVARHLGPVYAPHFEIAKALLLAEFAEIRGPVIIDVPDRHQEMAEFLSAMGFAPQRKFLRMQYCHDEQYFDLDHMYAIAGPEYG